VDAGAIPRERSSVASAGFSRRRPDISAVRAPHRERQSDTSRRPKRESAADFSGNSPFGFGWSPGIPAITRKADKGLPRYQHGEERDVFILTGAEDLVPIPDRTGARKRLPRTIYATAYQISYYHPRIAGLSRIEQRTATDSGISHWHSISLSVRQET
jgi:hypothetical protein